MEDLRKYFFKKATKEVKEFVRASNYQKISREKNGILLYTGRIGSSPCHKRFELKHSPFVCSIMSEING